MNPSQQTPKSTLAAVKGEPFPQIRGEIDKKPRQTAVKARPLRRGGERPIAAWEEEEEEAYWTPSSKAGGGGCSPL